MVTTDNHLHFLDENTHTYFILLVEPIRTSFQLLVKLVRSARNLLPTAYVVGT